MFPEPHATLQGVRIPSAILKILLRHILLFCFLKCSLGFDERRLSYRLRFTCYYYCYLKKIFCYALKYQCFNIIIIIIICILSLRCTLRSAGSRVLPVIIKWWIKRKCFSRDSKIVSDGRLTAVLHSHVVQHNRDTFSSFNLDLRLLRSKYILFEVGWTFILVEFLYDIISAGYSFAMQARTSSLWEEAGAPPRHITGITQLTMIVNNRFRPSHSFYNSCGLKPSRTENLFINIFFFKFETRVSPWRKDLKFWMLSFRDTTSRADNGSTSATIAYLVLKEGQQ